MKNIVILYLLAVLSVANSCSMLVSNNNQEDDTPKTAFEKAQHDIHKIFTRTLQCRVNMHSLERKLIHAKESFTKDEQENIIKNLQLVNLRLDDAARANDHANAELWGKDPAKVEKTEVHLKYANYFTTMARNLLERYELKINARVQANPQANL